MRFSAARKLSRASRRVITCIATFSSLTRMRSRFPGNSLKSGPFKLRLTLNEAQVSIALAAVSGGMFEIGDDLPTLGSDPERVALVKNPDLLAMAKLGRAALPLDLLTYADKDEQPSVFLLREDQRQSMLAVFNWTEQPSSHTFTISDLKLPAGHSYQLFDSLAQDQPLAMDHETLRLDNQPAHSVKLIKIIDTSIPMAAPSIAFHVPSQAKIGEEIEFSSIVSKDGVPALAYHWDFGDGVVADGAILTHAYTAAGNYTVRFTAEGLDGKSAEKTIFDRGQRIGDSSSSSALPRTARIADENFMVLSYENRARGCGGRMSR